MNVLIYLPFTRDQDECLQRDAELMTLDAEMEICRTVENLTLRLSQLSPFPVVAVLCAKTREDLVHLVSIRPQISNVSVILVLPDREEETINMGHSLYPRFLTFMDTELNDLKLVLRRLIVKYHEADENKAVGFY